MRLLYRVHLYTPCMFSVDYAVFMHLWCKATVTTTRKVTTTDVSKINTNIYHTDHFIKYHNKQYVTLGNSLLK